MWPFGSKNKAPAVSQADWVMKINELARRLVKLIPQVGPTLYKSVQPSGEPSPELKEKVNLEVMAFCMHIAERQARAKYKAALPTSFATLLNDAVAKALAGANADDIQQAQMRDSVRALYAQRSGPYAAIPAITAGKGQSEHGTLTDSFGKLMTSTYAGKNALARAVIGTTARELAKTVQAFLPESGI